MVESENDYVIAIRDLLLNKFSASIDTFEKRKSFVIAQCRLDEIWNRTINDKSNSEFVNTLIDQATKFGTMDSGQHPLLAILNCIEDNVGVAMAKEISDLKIRVISGMEKLEQAYVGLLVDSDFSNYIPMDSTELNYHGLIIENKKLTFNAISNRINNLGSKRRWNRKQYPYFNIDPWLHCNCEDLRHWGRVIKHFDEDRFLAVLVDVSIFDSSCSSIVENILEYAFTRERLGIACIMNHCIPSPNIPTVVEQNRIFQTNLKTISDIVDFLWERYDFWKINKMHGGSIITRTGE
jgi:hypothetical protein